LKCRGLLVKRLSEPPPRIYWPIRDKSARQPCRLSKATIYAAADGPDSALPEHLGADQLQRHRRETVWSLLAKVTTSSYYRRMKSVGIKQLKSRLSEYLRLVRSGEIVFVTDRDEVVAELRPTRRRLNTGDSLDELLESLAERGDITRASLRKRRGKWSAKGLGLAAGSALALLDEIRSDR